MKSSTPRALLEEIDAVLARVDRDLRDAQNLRYAKAVDELIDSAAQSAGYIGTSCDWYDESDDDEGTWFHSVYMNPTTRVERICCNPCCECIGLNDEDGVIDKHNLGGFVSPLGRETVYTENNKSVFYFPPDGVEPYMDIGYTLGRKSTIA